MLRRFIVLQVIVVTIFSAFGIQSMAEPGLLTLNCRAANRIYYNHHLSSQFDETDVWVIDFQLETMTAAGGGVCRTTKIDKNIIKCDGVSQKATVSFTINRDSGRYSGLVLSDDKMILIEGSCEPSRSTAFDLRKADR
jgi:hypothetical protein